MVILILINSKLIQLIIPTSVLHLELLFLKVTTLHYEVRRTVFGEFYNALVNKGHQISFCWQQILFNIVLSVHTSSASLSLLIIQFTAYTQIMVYTQLMLTWIDPGISIVDN